LLSHKINRLIDAINEKFNNRERTSARKRKHIENALCEVIPGIGIGEWARKTGKNRGRMSAKIFNGGRIPSRTFWG
jgi:hypothetical protein